MATGPLTDDRARRPNDDVGDQLIGWGTVVRIETTGRISGSSVAAAAGYIQEADGSLLVAAGSPDASWARNLEAEPRCRATIGDRTVEMLAEPLEPADAAQVVVKLILRYGTPAEGLGRGPAFRLRPIG